MVSCFCELAALWDKMKPERLNRRLSVLFQLVSDLKGIRAEMAHSPWWADLGLLLYCSICGLYLHWVQNQVT